jgi:TctA family transporter
MLLSESWTAGSAGTVVGEYSKARNGEAGRALSAAYSASAMGGLIGAILMAIVITTMSPALAEIDMLTISGIYIFALAVAASLTGRTPLKALAGVCLGLLIATIGDEPQTGTLRWTFNLIEFWDGVHIIPLALGLFALPELCDLAIRDRPTARSWARCRGWALLSSTVWPMAAWHASRAMAPTFLSPVTSPAQSPWRRQTAQG